MKNKKLLIVLVTLLVIVTLAKKYQNEITNYFLDRKITHIEETDNGYLKNTTDNQGLEPEYNAELSEEADIEDYLQNQGNFKNVKIAGRLVIPNVEMNIPILIGINKTHLLMGASEQLPRTKQKAGQIGNYILASHKMSNTRNIGFSRLHKVKFEDLIYVTDEEKVYTYIVDWNKTVKHSNTQAINETSDTHAIITLYTCSKFGKNTPKVVVRGHKIAEKNLKDITKEEKDLLFKKK